MPNDIQLSYQFMDSLFEPLMAQMMAKEPFDIYDFEGMYCAGGEL